MLIIKLTIVFFIGMWVTNEIMKICSYVKKVVKQCIMK